MLKNSSGIRRAGAAFIHLLWGVFIIGLILLGFADISNRISDNIRQADIIYQQTLSIVTFSIILYAISLFLPSYAEKAHEFNGRQVPIRHEKGYVTLLFGLALGWANFFFKGNRGAIAVYANLFYYYSVLRLLTSPFLPPVFATGFMLFLASLTFKFRHAGGELSSPLGECYTLWGWGAMIWLFTQVMLASVVVLLLLKLPIPSANVYMGVFVVTFLMLAGIQYYRYLQVNSLEKHAYFSKSIILITKKMSGLPYHPPSHLSLDSKMVIELATTLRLGKYPYHFSDDLRVVIPKQFQYRGFFWQIHQVGDWQSWSNIAELSSARPVDYVYQVQALDNLDKISLLTAQRNKFWQFLADNIFKTAQPKWLQGKLFDTKIYLIEGMYRLRPSPYDKKIVYTLLNSNHPYSWTATTINGYPDYRQDLLTLFRPLQLPKIEIIDYFSLIQSKQFFKKNKTVAVSSVDGIDNIVKLEHRLFHMADYDIADYYLWESQDFLILAPSQLVFREWNKLILFQKNPIKPLKTFAWLDNEKSFIWDETLIEQYQLAEQSYDDKNKTLINHPNALVITGLYLGFVNRNVEAPLDIIYDTHLPNTNAKASIIIQTNAGIFPAI